MTRLVCRDCGQFHKAPFKPEREDYNCPCGGRRALPSELKPRKPLRQVSERKAAQGKGRGSTLKRGRGFAVTPAQREKVKGRVCLGCGDPFDWEREDAERSVDPAHLWPRGLGGCDSPDCVIPLCRSCHRLFDEEKLDILPALIDRGYQVELAHPILEHGVSLTPLLERVTGRKWAPVDEAVAA